MLDSTELPYVWTEDYLQQGYRITFEVEDKRINIEKSQGDVKVSLTLNSEIPINNIAELYSVFIDIGKYCPQQTICIQKAVKARTLIRVGVGKRKTVCHVPKFSLNVTFSSTDHELYQTIRGLKLPPKKVFRKLAAMPVCPATEKHPIRVVY